MPVTDPIQLVRDQLNKLYSSYKAKIADGKLSFSDAYQLLQEFVADCVIIVDTLNSAGADKKALVLSMAQEFYTNIIAPIDLPFVPNLVIEPIVDRLIGQLIQPILGAMIEASLNLLRSGKTLAKSPSVTGSAPPSTLKPGNP